ncbi:dihydroxyacetone kinase subunit DhaK [Achromobacter xylosoxidans]
MAALGLPLAQVAAAAREAPAQLGSMGVALGGCTLPGAEKSGFTLADNEIELGLGIHGEKGVERSAMLPPTNWPRPCWITSSRTWPAAGARVALLVNGLGATPQMELDVVMRAAYDKLAARGIAVERAWSGTLLSALDMPGCSLSVLRVDDYGWRCWTRPRARAPGRAAGGSTRTSTSPRRRWSRARPRPRPTPPASAGSPP